MSPFLTLATPFTVIKLHFWFWVTGCFTASYPTANDQATINAAEASSITVKYLRTGWVVFPLGRFEIGAFIEPFVAIF